MKNIQKGFVVPLVIAIIAVLAIGGGIYYSKNKKVSISQEHSDWKTYTNKTYGFETKYPSSWSVEEKNTPIVPRNGGDGLGTTVSFKKDNYVIMMGTWDGSGVSPEPYLTTNAENFLVYNNEILPDTFLSRTKVVALTDIGNHPFFDVRALIKQSSGNYKTPQDAYLGGVFYKGKIYSMYFNLPDELARTSSGQTTYQGLDAKINQEILSEADGIISSFRFTK